MSIYIPHETKDIITIRLFDDERSYRMPISLSWSLRHHIKHAVKINGIRYVYSRKYCLQWGHHQLANFMQTKLYIGVLYYIMRHLNKHHWVLNMGSNKQKPLRWPWRISYIQILPFRFFCEPVAQWEHDSLKRVILIEPDSPVGSSKLLLNVGDCNIDKM